MLSVNLVDGNSSKVFEASTVELIRSSQGDTTNGIHESLSLRVTTRDAHPERDVLDLNFDSGTAYVMNSAGSTIGTYVLGRQGVFSPKQRKDVKSAA